MNPNEERFQEEIVPALEALKAAGWISGYSFATTSYVLQWTPHGAERARVLVAIDDELDPGANAWIALLAVCRFLGPDVVQGLGDGAN
jgi:hypothetical protein